MTTLITGATGAIGRHLVDVLVASGETVRATSRKPAEANLPAGVELAGADLGDRGSLTPELFEGVDRAFVFPAERGVDAFMEAAIAGGVTRFVVLSSLAVEGTSAREKASVTYTHHRAVEDAVTSRTDGWTMLRPGTFSNNLRTWAWSIRAGMPIRAPYPHSSQPPVHEADIAEVAAEVLTEGGHGGTAYALTGPESLTKIEQVAAIGAGIGRELELVEISPEEFRAEMAQFIPEAITSMLLDYWSDTVAEPDPVRPGVSEVLGRSGRTLQQWATDHRADFGA